MFCKKCGHEIGETAKYCEQCGCSTDKVFLKGNVHIPVLLLLIIIAGTVVWLYISSKTVKKEEEPLAFIPLEETLDDAERIIGEWVAVGEIDGSDGEFAYISAEESDVSIEFKADGTYVARYADGGVKNYTYSLTEDGYLKSYVNSEPVDPDYKISWKGEDLVLTEYYHETSYNESKKEFVRNMYGPYAANNDYDAVIFRKK